MDFQDAASHKSDSHAGITHRALFRVKPIHLGRLCVVAGRRRSPLGCQLFANLLSDVARTVGVASTAANHPQASRRNVLKPAAEKIARCQFHQLDSRPPIHRADTVPEPVHSSEPAPHDSAATGTSPPSLTMAPQDRPRRWRSSESHTACRETPRPAPALAESPGESSAQTDRQNPGHRPSQGSERGDEY